MTTDDHCRAVAKAVAKLRADESPEERDATDAFLAYAAAERARMEAATANLADRVQARTQRIAPAWEEALRVASQDVRPRDPGHLAAEEVEASRAYRGCPLGMHEPGEAHHYTCWAEFE